MNHPGKLRALIGAAIVTVALAAPIGVAAAAESDEPKQGASLEAPVQNAPLAPAHEAKESAGEAASESEPGVTENAPLGPEVIRHPTIPPASGGTTAEEPTKGEEEI